MRFLLAALTGLVASTVANPLTQDHEESKLESRRECNTGVRMIVVSGHGAPIHAGYGLLQTTVESVLDNIPDSSNFSVPYPKRSDDFPTAIATAAQHLNSSLVKYTARCPDTSVVLLGYSEGAQAIMNLLCGRSHIGAPYSDPLDSSFAQYSGSFSCYQPWRPRWPIKVWNYVLANIRQTVAAVVVYGDETRVANQSYDLGTCRKGQGVNPRGNPDGCAAFAPVMASWCDKQDPQCCGGNNQSQHYVYPTKYDDVATQFIVDQWYNHTGQTDGRL